MHTIQLFFVVALFLFLALETVWFLKPIILQVGILTATVILAWKATIFLKYRQNTDNKINPRGLAILVAGCDSEYGFLVASKLAHYGYHVFGGSQEATGDIAKSLYKYMIDVVELHPHKAESLNRAHLEIYQKLLTDEKKLHAIICNVGLGTLGELEWITDKELTAAFEQSVVGTLCLVNKFLPLLRSSKGRIIVCAGQSGRVAVPGAGVYSLINAALISLAECLRREMLKFKIQVILIEPIWLNYRTPLDQLQSAGACIKDVLRGVNNDVYEEYTARYFNAFRSLWNRRLMRWYLGPPDFIASRTCRAVNDTYCRQSYTCSYKEEDMVNILLQYLPGRLVDLAQCFFYQPYVRILLFSEEEDARTSSPSLIGSPGYVQKFLQSAASPGPASYEGSGQTSPARELEMLKEEKLNLKLDDPGDPSPPLSPGSPLGGGRMSPTHVFGEAFKPRRKSLTSSAAGEVSDYSGRPPGDTTASEQPTQPGENAFDNDPPRVASYDGSTAILTSIAKFEYEVASPQVDSTRSSIKSSPDVQSRRESAWAETETQIRRTEDSVRRASSHVLDRRSDQNIRSVDAPLDQLPSEANIPSDSLVKPPAEITEVWGQGKTPSDEEPAQDDAQIHKEPSTGT